MTQTAKTKVLKKPVAKAKEATKKTITQTVIVNRKLKYLYPKGCIDPLPRKSFRGRIRNAIYKMERDIAKLKGGPKQELKVKLKAFKEDFLA